VAVAFARFGQTLFFHITGGVPSVYLDGNGFDPSKVAVARLAAILGAAVLRAGGETDFFRCLMPVACDG
jgi:hypothetical protein